MQRRRREHLRGQGHQREASDEELDYFQSAKALGASHVALGTGR
jgi:hypothetical protein